MNLWQRFKKYRKSRKDPFRNVNPFPLTMDEISENLRSKPGGW